MRPDAEQLAVLADRGYYNGDEVLACEGTGVLPCIPKTQTSGNTKTYLHRGGLHLRRREGPLHLPGRQPP